MKTYFYKGWTIQIDGEGFATLTVPTGTVKLTSKWPTTLDECKERINFEWARMSVKRAIH